MVHIKLKIKKINFYLLFNYSFPSKTKKIQNTRTSFTTWSQLNPPRNGIIFFYITWSTQDPIILHLNSSTRQQLQQLPKGLLVLKLHLCPSSLLVYTRASFRFVLFPCISFQLHQGGRRGEVLRVWPKHNSTSRARARPSKLLVRFFNQVEISLLIPYYFYFMKFIFF